MDNDDLKLIRAIQELTDAIQAQSGAVGRGSNKTAGNRQNIGSTGKIKHPEIESAADALKSLSKGAKGLSEQESILLNSLRKRQQQAIEEGRDLSKSAEERVKADKKVADAADDRTDAEKRAAKTAASRDDAERDLQRTLKWSKERAQDTFKGLGKSLLDGTATTKSFFNDLGNGLGNIAKFGGGLGFAASALSKFAIGAGYVTGVMSSFADAARSVGQSVDLSGVKVGLITTEKLFSGLGDNFANVINESGGAFRLFGKTTNESIENLSNLSRSLRFGSDQLNSTFQKSLGTDAKKQIDAASDAIMSMGMSTEQQAKLQASLMQTARLGSRSQEETQRKLIDAFTGTVNGAKNLSQQFGVSAAELVEAVRKFQLSSAGKASGLLGKSGEAGQIVELLKTLQPDASDETIGNIATAIATGNSGLATAIAAGESQPFAQIVQALDANRTALINQGKPVTADEMMKIDKNQTGYLESIAKSYDTSNALAQIGLQGGDKRMGQSIISLQDAIAKRDETKSVNDTGKGPLGGKAGTEADNIKSTEKLGQFVNDLKGSISWLNASILANTGAVGLLSAAILTQVGASALLGKGFDKVGSIIGGLGSKLPGKLGDIFGKMAGATAATSGGVAGPLAGSATNAASGVFDKVGAGAGNASSSMSKFGDKVSSVLTGIVKVITDLGKSIAKGLGTIFAELMEGLALGLRKIADPKLLIGVVVLGGLASVMWIASKSLQNFADVKWEDIAKGFVVLGGLGAAALGISLFGAELIAAAPGLAVGAIAIAALGASLIPASIALKGFADIKWGDIAKAGTTLVGLGAAAIGISLFGAGLIAAAPGLAIGAIAIAALGASLIPASIAFKGFADIKWGDIAKGFVVLGGLGAAAIGISLFGAGLIAAAPGLAIGAIAIAALGASLIPASIALKEFADIKWEDIAKAGTALVGLGAAALVLGALGPGLVAASPGIAIGVIAIAALGASLIPAAYALQLFAGAAKIGAEAFQIIANSLSSMKDVSLATLLGIGPALVGIAVGLTALSAGGLISGVLDGLGSLFGVKSPLDKIKELAQSAKILGDAIPKIDLTKLKIPDGTTDGYNDLIAKIYMLTKAANTVPAAMSSMSLGLAMLSAGNLVAGAFDAIGSLFGVKSPLEKIQDLAAAVAVLAKGMPAIDMQKFVIPREVTSGYEELIKQIYKLASALESLPKPTFLQTLFAGMKDVFASLTLGRDIPKPLVDSQKIASGIVPAVATDKLKKPVKDGERDYEALGFGAKPDISDFSGNGAYAQYSKALFKWQGNIAEKLGGKADFIGQEPVLPEQDLTKNQMQTIGFAKQMGNNYSPSIENQYKKQKLAQSSAPNTMTQSAASSTLNLGDNDDYSKQQKIIDTSTDAKEIFAALMAQQGNPKDYGWQADLQQEAEITAKANKLKAASNKSSKIVNKMSDFSSITGTLSQGQVTSVDGTTITPPAMQTPGTDVMGNVTGVVSPNNTTNSSPSTLKSGTIGQQPGINPDDDKAVRQLVEITQILSGAANDLAAIRSNTIKEGAFPTSFGN